MADLGELLGSAVNEAKKHPELLSSVVDFAKGKIGGDSEPAAGKRSKSAAGTRTGRKKAATQQEGLAGMLGELDVAGLAQQVGSWVGTGSNERVSGAQVERALGPKRIEAAAKRAGVSEEEAAVGIAELLPAVVDYLTPDGSVPPAPTASKRLDALEQASTAKGS